MAWKAIKGTSQSDGTVSGDVMECVAVTPRISETQIEEPLPADQPSFSVIQRRLKVSLVPQDESFSKEGEEDDGTPCYSMKMKLDVMSVSVGLP